MAAGKQQELKSVIPVYGRADSSLDALAGKISAFGDQVSRVGTAATLATAPIAAALKQSTSLYTDYDDILRKIRAAGRYSEAQMQTIGRAARQAGADTRYMASDAASSFLSLTQAGVELESSLETLPTLLNAAAAGDMDLADASDLLISNIYSLGKAFKRNDVTEYMDKVVTAADASNTTVQEMMEGVSKIGAGGRLFAGGDSELLAFLGLLADLNMKGSTGGINARNMIISLLAPTQKAAKLMDALEISEEELDETLEGIDLTDSAKAMKWLGLETVDANGKVRPMIDILTDLKSATDALADDEKANILYNMFGKRTYPAIAGLLELLGEYPELIEKIGNAAGATQEKADTLEGGIGGATRTLKSAFEELQLSLGEAASGKVMQWMDAARGFMLDAADWIKGLDNEKVSTFLDAFAGIAGTGAALTLTGGALKTFSGILATLATPGGAIALGAVALTSLGLAIASAQDAAARKDLENHFGTLEMDSEKVSAWISSLAGGYESAAESISSYGDAVKTAGENYEEYVKGFSGGILEAYLTQTELNEADKTALASYVEAMIGEVKSAAEQQELQLDEIIRFTYSGENEGDSEKAAAWSDAIDGLFGELNKDAQAAGQNLMQVYLDAAADGVIDADERGLIAQAQGKLNDVMTQIQSMQSEIEWNTILAQAMDMSAESYEQAAALMNAEYAKQAAGIDQWKYTQWAIIKTAEDNGQALSESMIRAYGLANGYDYKGAYAGLEADYAQRGLDLRGKLDVGYARLGNQYIDNYMGGVDVDLSGIEALAEGIVNGSVTLEEALTQADEITGGLSTDFLFWGGDREEANHVAKALSEWMDTLSESLSIDELLAQIQNEKEKTGTVSKELTDLLEGYLFIGLLNGGNLGGRNTNYLSTDGDGNALLGGQIVTQAANLAANTPTAEEAKQKAGEYAGAFSEVIEESDVAMKVSAPDGGETADAFRNEVQENFNNTPAVLNVLLNALSGNRNAEKAKGKQLTAYATGGYADEPSLFGEDGGEWAIPQEKTENSRILLRRAAAGSGFSPEEVYPERKRTEKTAMSFTFAPTIYARDAAGVKETLENERAQMMELMEQWWSEKTRESERVSFA